MLEKPDLGRRSYVRWVPWPSSCSPPLALVAPVVRTAAESKAVHRAFASAIRYVRGGGVVVVAGRPGAGKTALLHRLTGLASRAGYEAPGRSYGIEKGRFPRIKSWWRRPRKTRLVVLPGESSRQAVGEAFQKDTVEGVITRMRRSWLGEAPVAV